MSIPTTATRCPSSGDDAPLTDEPPKRVRYYVLAILLVVYTLNFLDRQVLGILVKPIKAELGLSDTQVGLMGGLAFASLYATLGVPIAYLADRGSRRRIMAWSLALWSAFTSVCGLTHNFVQIFLARIGVGIGEAGGVAPAYSMISDYFPKHQRARALSVYSLGIPIGSAVGILAGGLIASKINWRAAFMIVGAVGIVVAPIVRYTIRDPKRGGWEAQAPASPARFRDVFGIVSKKSSFWLLAFGAASSSVCGYGVAFWLPSFFMRSLHLGMVETSWYYAAITLVGGGLGILGGGLIADRVGKLNRAAYPIIPAIAFMVAMPCFFAAVHLSSPLAAFPLFLVPTGLNLMWLGPILTAVQHLVPGHMRTTASAMFLLVNNLLGIALGYYYFGAVSDALKPHYGDESLRYAIYSGLGFYVIAAALFLIASRSLKKHWVD
ncbi:MAG TPA: MFS transporter [Kofleriaceae bacterium]|jgi:predicted MFS family arabinose efflux permease